MSQPDAAVAVARDVPARRSMVSSSFGLLVGKGLQAMAGFLFWVVAARVTSVREVGITAAAVSAVMMCTQLALLGAGSAVIVAVGSGRDARAVLDTAFSVVIGASILLGLGYLLVTSRLDGKGDAAAGTPVFWVVFVVAVVAGTVMLVLDQANVAFGRGGSSAPRYGLAGVATIGAVLLVGWQVAQPAAVVMFACWSVGAVIACVVGALQLRRLIGYRYRPSLHLRRSRRLLGDGIPNQVLTLTERAPGLLIPVLIANLVSPESAAYWYPAWMMAWAAYSAPVVMGIVHFSEGVRDPSALGRTTRTSLTWSIGTGCRTVLGCAALARGRAGGLRRAPGLQRGMPLAWPFRGGDRGGAGPRRAPVLGDPVGLEPRSDRDGPGLGGSSCRCERVRRSETDHDDAEGCP